MSLPPDHPETKKPKREDFSCLEEYLEAAHGIAPEVSRGRYIEFESVEQSWPYFRPDKLTPEQRRHVRWMLKWMAGGWWTEASPQHLKPLLHNPEPGGFLILRRAASGLEPILPEVKAWTPFPKRRVVHYHGDNQDPAFLASLRDPETDEPLKQWQIFTPDEMGAHIDGKRHGGDGTLNSGTNDQGVHVHLWDAKYLQVMSPRVEETRTYSHRKMYERWCKSKGSDDVFVRHLLKWHAFKRIPNLDEEHDHTRTIKDPSSNIASRVDIHELAEQRLRDAEVVLVGSEGCPKADAMLSAILELERLGELPWRMSVISVPAIWCWPKGETAELVDRYDLHEKRLLIIPDRNVREKKPDVESATFVFRQFLRDRLDCRVHVASPTEGKGADDHLVAGGHLLEMVVLDKKISIEEAADWLAAHGLKRRSDRFRTAVHALHRFRIFAGFRPLRRGERPRLGEIRSGAKSLAATLGTSYSSLTRVLREDLEPTGTISYDGSVETVKPKKLRDGRRITGKFKGKGGRFVHGGDWEDWEPPTIYLHPDLRADLVELGTIREVLSPGFVEVGEGEDDRGAKIYPNPHWDGHQLLAELPLPRRAIAERLVGLKGKAKLTIKSPGRLEVEPRERQRMRRQLIEQAPLEISDANLAEYFGQSESNIQKIRKDARDRREDQEVMKTRERLTKLEAELGESAASLEKARAIVAELLAANPDNEQVRAVVEEFIAKALR